MLYIRNSVGMVASYVSSIDLNGSVIFWKKNTLIACIVKVMIDKYILLTFISLGLQ